MAGLKSIRSRFSAAALLFAFFLLPSMQSTQAGSGVTTADSLALIQVARNIAYEKEKRNDAENQLLSTGQLVLDAVHFKAGETALSIASKQYLNGIGKMLLKYPKLLLEVGGHTDNLGDSEYNIDLSKGQAESVRNYLIKIAPGLSAGLSTRGYGMRMPKADNGTKEGRQSNWRVQLRVINTYMLKEYSQR
ncbi:MAG: OmpA family protein [Chitinispirillaceae bacterium]|nr:OmpA family protein [Chitinispirillaceae bacterium]